MSQKGILPFWLFFCGFSGTAVKVSGKKGRKAHLIRQNMRYNITLMLVITSVPALCGVAAETKKMP